MEYGTTFDGKSITVGVSPYTLANGQKVDYRHGGFFVQNMKIDFDRERVTFSIVDSDGLEFSRCDMGFHDVLTLILGPARTVEITGGARDSEQVAAYLPANYFVVPGRSADQAILVRGFDNCGWTVEDYIIPRLASGSIQAQEVI